ncbi:sporulation histidine kinase inhibitor Sda [Bacillus sp. REN3]|uniref:sporulation histidine kinase inhibitor Sda n=1 Tax=Bacillus sp. REN3 TaxID=2802440 RepID=UPI001FF01CDB|nr:sporulation histidine kinase inhibitor Sda [Bacillus sp. REN3]
MNEGVVAISSLWELTDEKLIEAYRKAALLKLDVTFITMLEEELENRGLAEPTGNSAS